jgi:putative SOS response-associated peptidase YedK
MCGRFTLTAEAKEMAKRFGVEFLASFYKRIAPTQHVSATTPARPQYVANFGPLLLSPSTWQKTAKVLPKAALCCMSVLNSQYASKPYYTRVF